MTSQLSSHDGPAIPAPRDPTGLTPRRIQTVFAALIGFCVVSVVYVVGSKPVELLNAELRLKPFYDTLVYFGFLGASFISADNCNVAIRHLRNGVRVSDGYSVSLGRR